MQDVRKIHEDLYWIGGNDRRLALFENVFPIPRGVSYNAYFVSDEKTVLLDTVDKSISERFFENLEHALNGRKLDYLIVNHMEPDHCGTMNELFLRYPDVKIVCNKKTSVMIGQFFTFNVENNLVIIKEGDTLNTGKYTFTFVMAPMVHWPEAMVTYEISTKTLFSADAFGTFGALGGSLFADEVDFDTEWIEDARRYYTNIVGKYGTQVMALLKKASTIEIKTICPLHGPIWRKNANWFIDKYVKWATYTPEEDGVVLAYASVYGNTENVAEILASKLHEKGVKNVKLYDVSATHPSYILAEAFRYSHLILASTTYNAGIFCNMETLLHDLKAHNLQNRTVALIENGSWAPTANELMGKIVSEMKNMTILENKITINSSIKANQLEELDNLAEAIAHSAIKTKEEKLIPSDEIVNPQAMFKLPYGLYVLTAREGDKDNGSIINTVMQITDTPKRVVVVVNKESLTHDMIVQTGEFNVSVLDENASFSVYKHFGFASGKDVNKFENFPINRTSNGITYVKDDVNAVLSAKVFFTKDVGTHTMFMADLTEAVTFSDTPSVTYSYYQTNVKPQPAPKGEGEEGYVCDVCGWVYEGSDLPHDIICPLCKHGADAFSKL